MKKVLLVLSLLIMPVVVHATSYNTPVGNDIGYNGCINFQDGRINASGSGYFGHCKKATCYTGEWKTEYYISSDMVTCTNGNNNYYVQTISDGCSQYSGSCTPTTEVKYCSLVTYYDCTKTRSGEVYVTPKPTLDSNNYLKSLSVSPGTISFNKNTLNYTLEVSKDVKNITVNALAESSKATVTISNNQNITDGTSIKIDVKAENGSVRTYTINVKYKTSTTLDSNNYLKSLSVSPGTISFNKNTLSYQIEVSKDVKNVSVDAVAESSKAKVTISNTLNVSESTPIKIEVEAENGSVRTYTISVKFKSSSVTPTLESNNYLKSLSVSPGTISFNRNTLNYELEVEKDVKNITVNAVAESSKAKVTISNNQNIKENTPIKIVVKASNGKTRTYTINIKFKEEEPTLDSNTYLSSLNIKEAPISFNKELLIYNIELDESDKSLDVNATSESEKSIVTIENNKELKENVPVKVTVKAESGVVRIYTINFKYKAKEPALSSNNLLKSLEVEGYNLKFNSSVNDYVLKVDKEVESLKVSVTLEDEKASYLVTGNNKLKNNSKVMIVVTAENGKDNVYTIKVKKKSNILMQLLLILLIAIIAIFGFKVLKRILPAKKDKNYDYE